MNTRFKNQTNRHVGDVGGPRVGPRQSEGGVGGYYVDAAHVHPSPTLSEGISPRGTAHVNPFRARLRERMNEQGGQYRAAPTPADAVDRNWHQQHGNHALLAHVDQRAAFEAFEAERQAAASEQGTAF